MKLKVLISICNESANPNPSNSFFGDWKKTNSNSTQKKYQDSLIDKRFKNHFMCHTDDQRFVEEEIGRRLSVRNPNPKYENGF